MKLFRKCLCLALVLLTMVSIFPCAFAEDDVEGEAYRELVTDQQKAVYHLIEEAISSFDVQILIPEDIVIYKRDLTDIIHAVVLDHPEYFWFLEEGYYYFNKVFEGNQVESFIPLYWLDGEEVSHGSQQLHDAMIQFRQRVNEIVAGIPVNLTTDYEIALYLHDYLASTVTYSLEGDHPSAYAAIVHGQAACYGYSKAYQCLLNAAGIRARTITGFSPDENGKNVGHAWNEVWLGGKCYYTDVTWDDQETFTAHSYFCRSLEWFSYDHYPDPEFQMGSCKHDDCNYYQQSQKPGVGYANHTTTAEEAAEFFILEKTDDAKDTFRATIRFDGKNFKTWLNSIGNNTANLLGLTGKIQVACSYFEDEVTIQLTGSRSTENIQPVTEMSLNQQSITFPAVGTQYQLIAQIGPANAYDKRVSYRSSDETVVTVDENGLLRAVGVGTATIQVTCGELMHNCEVVVEQGREHDHKATLREVPAREPKCELEGNQPYYLCDYCGMKFADSECQTPYHDVKEYIIPATGHVNLQWKPQMQYHTQTCECGETIPNTKQAHTYNDDGVCDLCGIKKMENSMSNPSQKPKDESNPWLIIGVIAVAVVGVIVTIVVIRKRRY